VLEVEVEMTAAATAALSDARRCCPNEAAP